MADDWQSESEMSKWSTTRKLAISRRKSARKAPEITPSFPDQDHSNIQERLQSLILGTRESWTYAIFWELSSETKDRPQILGWGDGYFKGDEPNNQRTPRSEQEHRKKVLSELNALISETYEEIEEDVTDSEWFFLVSLTESFVGGNGLPGRASYTSTAVWVTGVQRLLTVDCERARAAGGFGIQTMVYVPLVDGVIELGSSSLIFPCAEFDLLDRIRPLFKIKNNFSILDIGTDSAGSGSIGRPIQPEHESESSVGNQPMIQQGNNIISQRDNSKTQYCNSRDSESSDDRYIEVFTQILKRCRR